MQFGRCSGTSSLPAVKRTDGAWQATAKVIRLVKSLKSPGS